MTDEELEIEALRPPGLDESGWGRLLCYFGLMQVFTASDVKREGTRLRYYLDGTLRAVAETDPSNTNLPHGPFSVFYKDGQRIWIKGEYCRGRPCHETWVTYLPDGRIAETLDRGLH